MQPKYSILIQDLNADQVRRVVSEMDSGEFFVGASMSKPTASDTPQNFSAPVSPAPAALQSSMPEFDATGLPWDDRIHAGTKAKTADGAWKKKRGVQEIVFENVTKELRAAYPAPSAPAPTAPAAPAAPQAPVNPGAAAAHVAALTAQFQPPAPTAPAAPAAPPAPVALARDFQGFMTRLTALHTGGLIPPTYPQTNVINRINEAFKVTLHAVTDIAQNPQHVEYAWQCLECDKLDK